MLSKCVFVTNAMQPFGPYLVEILTNRREWNHFRASQHPRMCVLYMSFVEDAYFERYDPRKKDSLIFMFKPAGEHAAVL